MLARNTFFSGLVVPGDVSTAYAEHENSNSNNVNNYQQTQVSVRQNKACLYRGGVQRRVHVEVWGYGTNLIESE